ncbi:MAG TPA: cytochrome b [Stellaceae bacterium]|nr:cytochrome b [Stellaceae bacterium]
MVLLLQFAIAWTMPEIHRGTQPERLISLHLSFGILILVLVMARLVWRLGHPVPLISDNVPRWQRQAAQVTHGIFYVLLMLLPLMGWANASARGWTIEVFGIFVLPHILPAGSAIGQRLGDVHTFTAYVLLSLAGLHVAAAMYHHFWLRDRVLSRMLPGRN